MALIVFEANDVAGMSKLLASVPFDVLLRLYPDELAEFSDTDPMPVTGRGGKKSGRKREAILRLLSDRFVSSFHFLPF